MLCPTAHAMEHSFLSTGLLSAVPADTLQVQAACKALGAALPGLVVTQVSVRLCAGS